MAQTTRAWLADRMPAVAVMRCLGMRPREVVTLHLVTAAALGLAGSLVGAAAGLGVLALLPRLLADLLPTEALRIWQPLAVVRGVGLGLAVALLFCIGPLDAIRRVSPLQVLRRDVEPVLPPRWLRALLAAVVAGGVALTAVAQSGSLRDGLLFTAGLAVAGGVLALLTLGATAAAGRLGGAVRAVWLRHGLKALGRPGAATIGAAVALGIGVLLVLGVRLVERGLSDELLAELPANAPTAFFIDIQPDQWPRGAPAARRAGRRAARVGAGGHRAADGDRRHAGGGAGRRRGPRRPPLGADPRAAADLRRAAARGQPHRRRRAVAGPGPRRDQHRRGVRRRDRRRPRQPPRFRRPGSARRR